MMPNDGKNRVGKKGNSIGDHGDCFVETIKYKGRPAIVPLNELQEWFERIFQDQK